MIALLTNDLMFQSRVSGAAKNAAKTLIVDRSVEGLAGRCVDKNSVQVTLIDLSFAGVDLQDAIPALKKEFPNTKVIAFGPHVDIDRLEQAELAGADKVMTRGQFDRDLQSIIG